MTENDNGLINKFNKQKTITKFVVVSIAMSLVQILVFVSTRILEGLPTKLILSIILTSTITLTPLVVSIINKNDLLAPHIGIGVMMFIFFIPASIYDWKNPEKVLQGDLYSLDGAVLIAGISYALLFLGYFFFGAIHKRIEHRLTIKWETSRLFWTGLVLFIFGIIIKTYYFSTVAALGELLGTVEKVTYTSGNTQFIGFLLNLSFYGLIMLAIAYYNTNKKGKFHKLYGLILISAVITEVLLTLPTSRRWYLYAIIAYLLVPSYYSAKHISKKVLFVSFTIFITMIIFLFPVMKIHRLSVYTNFQNQSQLGFFDTSTISTTKADLKRISQEFHGYFNYVLDEQIRRYDQTIIVGTLMSETPSRSPYLKGATIFPTLINSLIPRFIWANKPTTTDQNLFGWKYGFIAPNDESTSVLYSYIGELYINYSWSGTMIGMFIYGIFFRYIYEICIHKDKNGKYSDMGIFFYTLFWTTAIHIEGLLIPSLSGMVQYIILLMPILLFLSLKPDIKIK